MQQKDTTIVPPEFYLVNAYLRQRGGDGWCEFGFKFSLAGESRNLDSYTPEERYALLRKAIDALEHTDKIMRENPLRE